MPHLGPQFWQLWGLGHAGLALWFLKTWLNPADHRMTGGAAAWLPAASYALAVGLLSHFILSIVWWEAGQLNILGTLGSGFAGQSFIGSILQAPLQKGAEGGK